MKTKQLKIKEYEPEAPLPIYDGGEPTEEFLQQLQEYEAEKRRAKLGLPFRIVRRAFDQRVEDAKWRTHLKLIEKKVKALDAKYGTEDWKKLCAMAREACRQAEIAQIDQMLNVNPFTTGMWLGRDPRRQGRRNNGQFSAKA
jgi:hypothetical protein